MIRVRWFRNNHEHRNYWLRLGLMRNHRARKIHYSEYPLAHCVDAGFDPRVANHEHRHTSVILVENGLHSTRCIVDSEDSFFYLSPLLLRHTDLYFCSGYNRRFFENGEFTPPYRWQTENEVRYYIGRARDLARECQSLFDRVRPFVPIGPNLHMERSLSWAARKVRNAHHKIMSRFRISHPWVFDFLDFEARYRQLLFLRHSPPLYDVVLLDTLWGWPRHRYALHLRLKELARNGAIVHARLNWRDAVEQDGGAQFLVNRAEFPIETGHVSDYERMLASSRLAVFATGFHWGWRNIMTLALMLGLPVHADRLLLQPWFDMSHFHITWNEDVDWPNIEGELSKLGNDEYRWVRTHNQLVFDKFLAPEKVADYFIAAANIRSV